MGYLGLDDYYSYQLIEKVIKQIEKGDTGNLKELGTQIKIMVKKLNTIIIKQRKNCPDCKGEGRIPMHYPDLPVGCSKCKCTGKVPPIIKELITICS